MIKKIKTIILSRFKNNKEEEWVKERRSICLGCNYNSLYDSGLRNHNFFLAMTFALSRFYSWLCGKSEEDVLGECTICGCSIFYKSEEDSEICGADKWEDISTIIKLNIRQQRIK